MRRADPFDKRAATLSVVLHGAVFALAWISAMRHVAPMEFMAIEIELVSPPPAAQAEEPRPAAERVVVERPREEPPPREPEPDIVPVEKPTPEPEPGPSRRSAPTPERTSTSVSRGCAATILRTTRTSSARSTGASSAAGGRAAIGKPRCSSPSTGTVLPMISRSAGVPATYRSTSRRWRRPNARAARGASDPCRRTSRGRP